MMKSRYSRSLGDLHVADRARVLTIIGLLLFAASTNVIAQGWRGIIPCVTTRLQAEKMLGRDPTPDIIGIYHLKKYRVNISYARPNTSAPKSDIVLELDVYLDDPVKLKSYAKKLRNFPKDFYRIELPYSFTHVYGAATYTNGEKGFAIKVAKDEDDEEVIYGFEYFGTTEECEKPGL